MKDRIKLTYPLGYFTHAWAQVYMQLSEVPLPKEFNVPHKDMLDFLKLVYKFDVNPPKKPVFNINQSTGLLPGISAYPDFKFKASDKRVLLGFSGGKDSIATAIKLRQKGHEVIAFHVESLNISARGEKKASENVANAMGMQFISRKLVASGFSERWENPSKNFLILAMMLDYGGPLGIRGYALGNETPHKQGIDGFSEYNTYLDFSDWSYALQVGARHFRNLNHFQLHESVLGFDMHDSYTTLFKQPDALKLLALSSSCMSQFQYQAKLNSVNRTKYGVDLMAGRCGSCTKCCIEYLYLCAFRKVKRNQLYVDHCWRRLMSSVPVQSGVVAAKVAKMTVQQVKDSYFVPEVHDWLPEFKNTKPSRS